MKTVAFVHASVAYPNYFNSRSLVLNEVLGVSILERVIKACDETSLIDKVVVVTSDHPDDAAVVYCAQGVAKHVSKEITIHQIPEHIPYSFKTSKEKQKRFWNLPYVWYPSWGLFDCEGFQELAAQFHASHAVVIEAVSNSMLSSLQLTELLTGAKDCIYAFSYANPERFLLGAPVETINRLISKYKAKLKDKVGEGGRALLFDLVAFDIQDGNKQCVISSEPQHKQYFLPLLRSYEYDVVRCLSAKNWQEFNLLYQSIEPGLCPFVPEYLELELTNQCNESCSFCPVSVLPEGKDELSEVTIRKRIQEFARTGIVLNFSGYGEPLLSANVHEYIKYAKEQGIISVWLETNGTLLTDEKLLSLVRAHLDVLVININVYREQKEKLEALITRIERVKNDVSSLFPLVILQGVIDLWETADLTAFIADLQGRVHHVALRSARNFEDINLVGHSVDFSPLNRTACLKVVNSLGIRANGKTAICEQDRMGQCAGDCGDELTLTNALNNGLHSAIFNEQLRAVFSGSFDKCAKCKEWYVPNLPTFFGDIDFSQIVKNAPHCYKQDVFKDITAESIEEIAEQIRIVIGQIENVIGKNNELIKQLSTLSYPVERYPSSPHIYKHIASIEKRIINLKLLRGKAQGFLTVLADKFMQFNLCERGIELWEEILKQDPANSFIHERLNALSEKDNR